MVGFSKLWHQLTAQFAPKEKLIAQIENELQENCSSLPPSLSRQLVCLTPLEQAEIISKSGSWLTPMGCHWLKKTMLECGAVEHWLNLLATAKDETTKLIIIEVLGLLRINEAMWPLVEVLKKGTEALQMAAVKALQQLSVRPLLPVLIEGIKKGEFLVPARVAPIILMWPDSAVLHLKALLNEKNLDEKAYVVSIEMLAEIKRPDTAKFLLEIFPHHQPKVQVKIIAVLSNLDKLQAKELAIRLLESSNWLLRLHAVTTLQQLGEENWQDLIAPLTNDENKKVSQTVSCLLSH